jgi:hypothetical protein
MKAFKLTMMAAMFAFASAAMAQKLDVLKVDPIAVANGEEAELVINMDYDNPESKVVVGLNFSLYLPDGILLKGFDTKEAQDAAKASALKKACDLGEDGIWGEDATSGWLSVKQKTDGGLLFVLIDQDDKTPFETTKATAITVNIHAVADVVDATGTINTIGMADDDNKSIELGNINDVVFTINGSTDGINDIKSSEATAPAYNLQGIRVNNAKGLIIRDGKKTIVK